MFSYRRPFTVPDLEGLVVFSASFSRTSMRVTLAGIEIGSDQATIDGAAGARNLVVRHALADGRGLEVEANYVTMTTVGIAVRVDGVLVHESHPGKVIAWPVLPGSAPEGMNAEQAQAFKAAEKERVRRATPSLVVDLVLGLAFFFVARETDLQTAAIVGFCAGVALLVIQRFVPRVDLVGGLALFGIAVMGVSALYAVLVQDDELIKMRSTIIGGAVALLFLLDGLVMKGALLAARLVRYFPVGTDARRLGIGMGLVGAVTAVANALVVRAVSTDTWLWYTTFGDLILTMVLFAGVMYWARPKAGALPPP